MIVLRALCKVEFLKEDSMWCYEVAMKRDFTTHLCDELAEK